ncbi:SRP1/TIP1 family protein NDAI_0G04990 [Naumovozyma dairenensis CBS 421]|uniref:Uncharacterized protein n=1 Tax=Naumovozyma dairenensis (strain ATCC 10597 / BCRC 20456 / CBS 421 / NBRC 0211 / NRRL Y-12639) TaxID=1071378 RepID=J7RTD1_NAUDC|nr:hypothetical protein NDAI_0G04990 [Naumovozyma dairenensis CBS 421]CCK73482.1 hypothetical protein NDAI_0G04990 [Naumovozyma dairenensis CBS 421]
MNTKAAALLATLAIVAPSVASAAPASPSAGEVTELNVLLNDVKSNLNEYISLAFTPGSGVSLFNLPAGVLDVGLAIAGATDDSYTTLYSKVDFAGVDKMITKLPWYSSRIEPAIESAILGSN